MHLKIRYILCVLGIGLIYLHEVFLVVLLFKYFFKLFIYLFICSEFCHTLEWNSHGFTCVPHPDPPSHLPLPTLF